MNKFIIAAILATVAMNANAQDVTETAPVSPPVAVVTAPSPELLASFTTICASTAVLSDKARIACINATTPKAAKDGATFRNVGIGSEFNTLIRNIASISG